MADETRHTYGSVPLELGERSFVLRATIEAADKIDAQFGGIMPAIEQVRAMNGRAIAEIIAIGVGTPSKGGKEKLRQMIHEEGRANVATAAVQFLAACLDPTGKMSEDDELEPAEGND